MFAEPLGVLRPRQERSADRRTWSALNAILAEMKADGTLSKLSTEYLSRDVTAKP